MANEGFQDYERVRRYAEHIYLYGFLGRKDFDEIVGGSAKDFDTVLPFLKAIFPKDSENGLYGHKLKQIRRRYASSGENRMTRAYMLHSINIETYLLQYLTLLSALRQGQQKLQALDLATWNLPGARDSDTYANAIRRLGELKDYGCMQEKLPVGQYALQPDTYSDEQVQQLHAYVCFAAEVTYPRVPGSFLRRTLERELYRRGLTPTGGSPFILRHNTSHNVFEEEIVFLLLDAIAEKRWVQINQRRYLPVQLRPECRYGRWYVVLVEWYKEQLSPSIRPLSRVTYMVVLEQEQDGALWQQAKQTAARAYEHSLYSGRKAEKPVMVEIRLCFGEQRGLKNQFVREIRKGQIVPKSDGTYYQVMINDPTELQPLLRAYSPWLQILPGDHDLNETLCNSLSDMHGALTAESWTQPDKNRGSDRQRKTNNETRSRGELLNKFQSREMQFALELIARLEGGEALKTAEVAEIAQNQYGLPVYQDLLKWLIRAGFLRIEEDQVFLSSRPAPVLPMGKLEREYLQYILTLPEAELFLTEQTRQALGGKPPAWMEHICRFEPKGMQLPRNPGPEGFRLLLEAIKTRRYIRYRYRQKGSRSWQEAKSLPWKLEYSAYDRRWWIILYDSAKKRTIKAALNHLCDVHMEEESGVAETDIVAAMDLLRMDDPVVLRITDSHNALQRCFLTFENQENRNSRRILEDGQLYYELSFDWHRFDEEEILRRLMHLGANVALIRPEPLRQKLIDRVEQAMELNRKPAELAYE